MRVRNRGETVGPRAQSQDPLSKAGDIAANLTQQRSAAKMGGLPPKPADLSASSAVGAGTKNAVNPFVKYVKKRTSIWLGIVPCHAPSQ